MASLEDIAAGINIRPVQDDTTDPMTGWSPYQQGVQQPDNPAGPMSALQALAGTQFGTPRVQLWPERLVRSAVTAAGDALSNQMPDVPLANKNGYPRGLTTEDLSELHKGFTLFSGGHMLIPTNHNPFEEEKKSHKLVPVPHNPFAPTAMTPENIGQMGIRG